MLDRRDEKCDHTIERHAPPNGDDPFRIDERKDQDEPGCAARCIPERRGRVIVESGETTRREAGEEMRHGGGNHPAQAVGTGFLGDV